MVTLYRLKDLHIRLPAGAHVIKAEAANSLAGSTALLDEAERKAAQIVEEAQRHYEQEKIRGYREGAAQASMEAVTRLLEEEAKLESCLAAINEDLADIVIACVRKIIDRFDDRDLARAYIRTAVRKMCRQRRIRLSVSAEQYPIIRDQVESLAGEFTEIEAIDVVENVSLTGTQFILESEIGRIEGSVEDNLEQLGFHLPSTLTNYVARLRNRDDAQSDRETATQEDGASGPDGFS